MATRDIDPAMVRLSRGQGIGVSHESRRAYHGGMKTAVTCALALAVSAVVAAEDAWPVAGQQGLVRYVIVPESEAKNADAYLRQIKRLCEPERTCFLNFYTNSRGAAAEMPLPDSITSEATATFRRSTKNGAERFQWSCRMAMPQQGCF